MAGIPKEGATTLSTTPMNRLLRENACRSPRPLHVPARQKVFPTRDFYPSASRGSETSITVTITILQMRKPRPDSLCPLVR